MDLNSIGNNLENWYVYRSRKRVCHELFYTHCSWSFVVKTASLIHSSDFNFICVQNISVHSCRSVCVWNAQVTWRIKTASNSTRMWKLNCGFPPPPLTLETNPRVLSVELHGQWFHSYSFKFHYITVFPHKREFVNLCALNLILKTNLPWWQYRN